MSKNPFQILDFLGYFFPGAMVMIAVYYLFPNFRPINWDEMDTSALVYIVCVIVAYIIGHIVALVSSITVEKYVVWKYGYPSDYLLNDYQPRYYLKRANVMNSRYLPQSRGRFIYVCKIGIRLLVWILLLPISLFDILFSWLFGINYYYTRKLSVQQIMLIKDKCTVLFNTIGISENPEKLFEDDYHRIVHNYYYENAEKHRDRMDNCVAIYDFLRAMSLVFCVLFYFYLIQSLATIDINAEIDWSKIGMLVSIVCVTYIFFMGFMKFYRKFTVENFMCLLTDSHFDFPKGKESRLISKSGTYNIGNQNFTIH